MNKLNHNYSTLKVNPRYKDFKHTRALKTFKLTFFRDFVAKSLKKYNNTYSNPFQEL